MAVNEVWHGSTEPGPKPRRDPDGGGTAGSAGARGRNVAGGKRVVAPSMVGRTEELTALTTAVSAPPAIVVVEGEAGIGKTRLISELRVRSDAGRVLVGACRPIREPFPLGPVMEVVKDLGAELRGMALSPVAGALRPLVPEVADSLPPQPPALDDRNAERHRVFRALLEVLAGLGRAVLVLEDLHWADDHTLDFVSYVVSDPPRMLSMVLTYRDGEATAQLRAATAKMPASVTRTHIHLTAFDGAQTQELTAAVLGADAVSQEFAAHLCERASGLPFAIEELLALLQTRGTLVQHDGVWERKDIDRLEVPSGIRDPVLERVSRLSDDARAMVEAAAVLQLPATLGVLMRSCRTLRGDAGLALEEVLESRLLVDHAGSLAFRHTLAAQAVYEDIAPPRRQDLHSRAADALSGLSSRPRGQVTHHLRYAGRLAEWAEAAELAADQAGRLGHHDEAMRLLQDLLREEWLEHERRARVAIKFGSAAIRTMRSVDETVELLSQVSEDGLSPETRGELNLIRAVALAQAGADATLQRAQFIRALPDLTNAISIAQAMVGLAAPIAPGVPLAEHKRWLRRLVEIVPSIEGRAWQVALLGKVAMVQVAVGDAQWRAMTVRIRRQTGDTPRHFVEVNAFHSVAQNAYYAGHHAVAGQLLAIALEGAIDGENWYRELLVRATRSLLDHGVGYWADLDERVSVLINHFDREAFERRELDLVAGCLAAARGDVGSANQALRKLVRRLEKAGAFDLIPLAANTLIRLALGGGDAARAASESRRLADTLNPVPFEVSALRALPAMCAAMVADEQPGQARELLAHWSGRSRGLDAPYAAAAVPHARGFIAGATGSPFAAARHFFAAADAYDRLSCPYEAAQAREEAGTWLLKADAPTGRTQGEETLRSAMAGYQRLGATWDLARTTRVARALGVPVPTAFRGGRRGYGDRLSPQELKVAEMAAGGKTNKEIAAGLFLSVNTVKRHLAAAMRKLDVHSRQAIADRLTGPTQNRVSEK
ncbi:AAA family ATPase [Micromonospora sp. NPDC005367]|uniref:helix-turn-helix transcriptional regulator n=1 Tax=Micromonospora sp. NPDC005367 TaxID=3155590 RepID=UPI0033BBE51C